MDIKYLILIANVIFCLVSSLALSAYVRNHDANKRPACLISCIYFAFFAAVSATVYFLPRFYDFTTDVHARYFILPAAAFMLLAGNFIDCQTSSVSPACCAFAGGNRCFRPA